MNKKAKIVLERHGGTKYVVIDNQPYALNQKKPTKRQLAKTKTITVNLTPVNRKEYEKRVNELVEALASKVDVKEWLRQALFDAPLDTIIQVKKELKKKKKPRISTKKGCLDLIIGKSEINLRD